MSEKEIIKRINELEENVMNMLKVIQATITSIQTGDWDLRR